MVCAAPAPITLDRDWLTYDMDVTEADLSRLATASEHDVNMAIENAADYEFWEKVDRMRKVVINDLLGTNY